MNKSFGKYLNILKNLSFLSQNDLKANLVLILGICLFFVVAEDLGREFSVERNEIDTIIAVSENSVSLDDLNASRILLIPECSGFVILNENSFQEDLLRNITKERAPPYIN